MSALTLTGVCPLCGCALVIRHTKQGHAPFVGCSGYPICRYTAPFEPALHQLSERLRQTEIALAQEQQRRASAEWALTLTRQAPSQALVAKSAVSRELRTLAAMVHPDRWLGHEAVAEEACKLVLALREKVEEGRI